MYQVSQFLLHRLAIYLGFQCVAFYDPMFYSFNFQILAALYLVLLIYFRATFYLGWRASKENDHCHDSFHFLLYSHYSLLSPHPHYYYCFYDDCSYFRFIPLEIFF